MLFVFKWIVSLGVRHRTTLEPTIEDFIYTSKHTLALLRWDSDLINLIPVDVSNVGDT